MVSSVKSIPPLLRNREEKQPQAQNFSEKNTSFARVLQQAIEESKPLDCQTITYDSDSRLQTFLHQSREYTY